MRLLFPFLFLAFFSAGCTSETEPSPEVLNLPFSVTDELTPTKITGRIMGYDSTRHPASVSLSGHSWYGMGLERENYFLESDGRFAFTVRDNVIRDYSLQYDNQFFEFALIPGTEPYVELSWQDSSLTFSAPHDTFVTASNFLIEALANEDYWERGNLVFNYQTNLDTMQRDALLLEEDMRQRFDSLWLAGGYEDPALREFVSQFVAHRTRRTLPFKVRELSKENERTANNQKFLYPEMGRELPDQPVYNMNNVNRVQNEFALLSDLLGNRALNYPKAERKEAVFQLYLGLIDSVYTGFSRDILRAGMLHRYLRLEEPPAAAKQLAAEMVQTTPYPALREPLEERLRILNQVVRPMDAYEQSMLSLPAGLDNPIPAILEENAGKVVVLDFWATWCGPCVREMTNEYPTFIRKYSPDEVAFVFLARHSSQVLWRDQISKLQFSAQHYFTDASQTAVVNELFGIGGIPHHTVFDQAGTLVQAKANGPGYGLEKLLDDLLKE